MGGRMGCDDMNCVFKGVRRYLVSGSRGPVHVGLAPSSPYVAGGALSLL